MANAKLRAGLDLWLLNIKLEDLEAYHDGDVNRFGRMVDAKGASLGSEDAWRASVATFLADDDIRAFYPDEFAVAAHRASQLGIVEVTTC